ncbi:hypothetical protein Pla100_55420 [Neorhodopirellula pilleata]|uniref:Uncharacterized protein n=1 Tax=Neorhodopirellula pilleata TaxID=2714738 RepID=A0A5C5ZPI3_9BACT|nr:hypothetical protein Pla100_55420 [Neorhodopirellula pilleata]
MVTTRPSSLIAGWHGKGFVVNTPRFARLCSRSTAIPTPYLIGEGETLSTVQNQESE